MPALPKSQATEKLARVVENAKPTALAEIYAELFPESPALSLPAANELAQHVRGGLAAEEVVDLWNVIFPADCNVYYDEESGEIHYNEELVKNAE